MASDESVGIVGGIGESWGVLTMNARFERVDTKFDHLERDLQAVAKRVFPEV